MCLIFIKQIFIQITIDYYAISINTYSNINCRNEKILKCENYYELLLLHLFLLTKTKI